MVEGGRERGGWYFVQVQNQQKERPHSPSLAFRLPPSSKKGWQTPSTGLRHPSFKEGAGKRGMECMRQDVVNQCSESQTPSTGLRHPSSKEEAGCRKPVFRVWGRPKLQVMVYDIHHPRKRQDVVNQCLESGAVPNSKHWFTTSFLQGRCRHGV